MARLGRSPLPCLECEPCETYDVGDRRGRVLNLRRLMSQFWFWVKALTLRMSALRLHCLSPRLVGNSLFRRTGVYL
jgi:hypothetical protein